MKNKMKQLATAAVVMLLGNTVFAQTNLNLNSTTNAAAKATVNTSKIADVVNKTTQATTRVIQATGKVAQTTVNVTTRTTANLTAKTGAAANAEMNGNKAKVKNETTVNAHIKGETNAFEQGSGIITDAEELVVTEAKGVHKTTKEMRDEVKPGLNISSNNDATANGEFTTGDGSAGGEVNGNTEVNNKAELKTDKVKTKAANTNAAAKQKAKTTVKKVKNTKAEANLEVSAASTGTVAGR